MNTVDKNPSNYYQFLSEIVTLVQQCRVIAVQMVQNHSNQLYWSIGEQILKRHKEYGWGKNA